MSSGSRKRNRRGAARLAAVQILYEMELAGASSDAVLRDFLAGRWNLESASQAVEPDSAFLADLVRGVTDRRADIDPMVGAALSADWTLERLEVILQAILRAGAYELLAETDIPPRVVITEYVDVAHAFFSGNEPGLVNGVLDRLAHTLRPDELEAADGGQGEDER
jgi:transcription antitermination protein NusB